jgi:glycosyltransferase involved in cell wall biosynthesis
VSKALKITWLGFRAFPNVQGGIETHAENLCPILIELGYEVEAITRAPYMPKGLEAQWKGIKMIPIWSPKTKQLEAVVHSILGVLYAGLISRPDILHIQGIGPAIVTPLAKFFGLKVVVTHHGPDYDRQKWGALGRGVLKIGERWGMRFADHRVVISEVIRNIVQNKYGLISSVIPNGVRLPELPKDQSTLARFKLEAGKYVLIVSRIVPEKRQIDLIHAFSRLSLADWKLVLVGASDHPDEYTRSVEAAADSTPRVVRAGFQSGENLRQLYAFAGLFVLPSSHEGLPIALLEALSYGLPVIASDIPANIEVGLSSDSYFQVGNINSLTDAMQQKIESGLLGESQREAIREWLSSHYDWHSIANQYGKIYSSVASHRESTHQ